jgi:succinyl-CoA synthetase beta subunit
VRAAAVLGKRDGGNLTEAETKEILAAYGIAVPRGNLVKTAGEAAAAARRIGFPVALKVVSPEITHKTEVGGISLGLADEAQLRLAWDRMRLELAAKLPAVVPEGFLVEEMLPVRLELIVGARNDPVFGPLLLLGPGGVLVELNRDLSLHFAPVSPARVVEMIGELKSAALFQGFRGSAAVDLNPLAEAVSRFSRLAADLRGSYREIEINPLALCAGGRVVAADALLLR